MVVARLKNVEPERPARGRAHVGECSSVALAALLVQWMALERTTLDLATRMVTQAHTEP